MNYSTKNQFVKSGAYSPISWGRQTYLNSLYLLCSFPLGICYFVLVVLSVVFSIAALVIIAIPLMYLLGLGCWRAAVLERLLVTRWLHVDIPPMSIPLSPGSTRWQRLRAHVSNPVTWKSLLYLFLCFPSGIIGFVILLNVLILMLVLSILSFITGFLIAPFVYLYATLSEHGVVDGRTVKRYFYLALTAGGVVLWPLSISNGLAWMWGQFARTMLGMSDSALRLAQTQQLLEQEHARAESADQKRRDLIINVSHELRTPVASIQGHIESLLLTCEEGGVPPAPALKNYLTIVHRESERLGSLVEDLLALARTEKSDLQLNMTEVQAGEVVEEVYQTLMPLARRERRITIVRSIEPGLPKVQADRQRLVQVLLNLVRNAVTYTPDGGIVSIGLKRADACHLQLSVSDTGIGIDPEELDRIFDRFYRSDASRTRASGGFGLGLSIVRDFVTAMGGTVSAESVPGEGSSFHVLLQCSN